MCVYIDSQKKKKKKVCVYIEYFFCSFYSDDIIRDLWIL